MTMTRDRVNINYRSWKEFTGSPREALLTEIMKHFSVHEGWIKGVKRAALCKARDASKNWKYMLTKYFVRRGREPFKKYKSITEDDWGPFKKTRKTKDFKELSKKQKDLVAQNTNPHNMGVAGYYGMSPIWKQHDDWSAQTGTEIPFADVNCSRGRAYLLARSKLARMF
jgi:hypothetical protein